MDRDIPFALETSDDLFCRPLDGIPTGFTLSGDGIHFETAAGEPIWVCSPMMAAFAEKAEERLGFEIGGTDRRAIQRFALIALAGKLATVFGVTGWNKQDAEDAALATLGDWYDRTSGPSEQDRLTLIKTSAYLSGHIDELAV